MNNCTNIFRVFLRSEIVATLLSAVVFVFATGCNPLSTQDDVAAGLASMGVECYAMHGVNAKAQP